MNTELRKNAKNHFEKDFFKLMNNSVFGKTMENVRKHKDVRIVTTDEQRSFLPSEPIYHSTKYISKDLLIIEMKKAEVKMNKPIYLGQAILDISKTLMYGFWYDYIKPKYTDNVRLCYMDTDSFIMYIKTEDFYKDIAPPDDRWFATSNYDQKLNRPLQIGNNKKVICKFKDELRGNIMTDFCALRAKTYSFLIEDYSDDDYKKNNIINKKDKGTKKCIVKREIIFNNYVDSLFNNKVLIKSQHRFKSDHHNVYTEEINKIALSSNDDKRIQTSDKITTYPYGMILDENMSENEMLRKRSELLRIEAQKLRKESRKCREETYQITAISRKLRQESRRRRNETDQIIARSKKQLNDSTMLSELQKHIKLDIVKPDDKLNTKKKPDKSNDQSNI